ncbi:MAG: Tol-Pal system beta propeller repeat protein TolB [Hyphomonadaceae bacterium]|nr:Tol-Pal system beta propeller repeat protein TolB [Hyphomonadaceae bacterium]
MHVLKAILVAVAATLAVVTPARAELEIDITRGHLNPMPVAVPDFIGTQAQEVAVGRQVAEVIRANLTRSSLFRITDPAAYLAQVPDVNTQPRFSDWKVTQAQALVVGQSTLLADGRLRIEFRLWDVFGESEALASFYATTPENWRRVAHKISDAIYKRLTGEDGYFDTRIVFVSETGQRGARRVKQLMIMDQDGANPSILPTGTAQVITPRFSPTAQQITFMSFETGRPRVFLYNIETGRREVLGEFGGMSYAPRFSPRGDAVVMTLDLNGNSEIHRMDLRSRTVQRLTNNPSIDTSPSFSKDGDLIVFNSDRGGSRQIYTMNADGSNVQRISTGQGSYTTPVWSPRGDLIAFTKQVGGRFGIGVMRPDGTGERMLSESYLDEGPTWSPNGRVIMFFREARPGAGPKLWSVDLTGQNLRQLTTPYDASDPAWSPLLP